MKSTRKLKTTDQIDENGEYIIPITEEFGSIRFVAMKNNQLQVDYYRDSEKTNPILGYWVEPGDTIYADVKVEPDTAETYQFSHFVIETYIDGKRTVLETSEGQDGTVYEIPIDYDYEQLIVEPVGKYVSQALSLNAYYLKDGAKNEMTGEWTVEVQYID